jgi:hypothetical protein
LKGSDKAKAMAQIDSSIDSLLHDEVVKPQVIYARIVMSKTPPSSMPLCEEEKRLRKKLKISNRGENDYIITKSRKLEENLV